MKIIANKDINRAKWDELVLNSGTATIYNQSHFLDGLAENWDVLVVGDYEAGLALPYSIRMNIHYLYTPNFIRTFDWLGEIPSKMDVLEEILSNRFKRFDFRVSNLTFSHSNNQQVYQFLSKEMDSKLSTQAKRSLKKYVKTALKIEEIDIQEAFPMITGELVDKVKTLRKIDLDRFISSYSKLENKFVLGVFNENELGAAAIFVEWKNEILYIKGGAIDTFKNNGAMYGLIQQGIERAKSKNKDFNFEGSTVEGVRKFNLNFGAEEKYYNNWKWTKAPFWFRLLLKIKGHE